MTRERIYGSDTEFCAWMREQKELPSFGKDFGMSASDNDVTIHRYMASVDGLGSREVQALMQIEIKTRAAKPSFSQIDTLSKLNLFAGERKTKERHIRFFGVFVLVLSGTSPSDSENMWWGRIPKESIVKDASHLSWTNICLSQLISLIRFDIHPSTLEKNAFRRHHKTSQIVREIIMPLGFQAHEKIITRS